MKIIECEQGSPTWYSARLGIPTASQFHRIVTPTGRLSSSAKAYAHYLIAETLLGRSLETEMNLEWIERGRQLEPEAARAYEFSEGVEARAVGFVTTDDGRIGASPDRLIIGEAAGLEIKCPAPQTHIGYLLGELGDHYKPQVQGQMLVCEFERVDLWSYSPEMPPALIRTERDEPYIAKLRDALGEFCDRKDELIERLRQRGLFAERRRMLTPTDQLAAWARGNGFGLPPLPDAGGAP
jgi:hypothetical protein